MEKGHSPYVLSPLIRTARRRAMTEHRERMAEEAALRYLPILHGHSVCQNSRFSPLNFSLSSLFSSRSSLWKPL